jgi:hypothetical protein
MKKTVFVLFVGAFFVIMALIAMQPTQANNGGSPIFPSATPLPRATPKIRRNPNGVCTGCCDPCYTESQNRRKPRRKGSATQKKARPKGILPYIEQNNRSKARTPKKKP